MINRNNIFKRLEKLEEQESVKTPKFRLRWYDEIDETKPDNPNMRRIKLKWYDEACDADSFDHPNR